MSAPDASGPLTPTGTISSSTDRRRVAFATVVGTTVEWYDFFIYAFAAGVVFETLFFAPWKELFPGSAAIISFATVGISFLFRPLGAFLAGHYGDKFGRRPVLIATLVLMGAATTLIGVLPTYAMAGVIAPIILILLRILQGISAGGEWGGAVLMAVEHAPKHRRGLMGAMPQIGVPIGLLLASGMNQLMTLFFPGDSFFDWGWRIPFLFSFVLILVGHYVRRRVEESPVFQEIAERKEQARAPISLLFRRFAPLVILCAFVFAANNAVGYMTTGGFIQRYASNPEGPVGLPLGEVLGAVTLSSVTWLIATFIGGWLSDKIGRKVTYTMGWIWLGVAVLLVFPLVNSGSVALLALGLILLTIGLGFSYGPQSAWYSELFPASVRFSGVSISYAIGAIIGGAFAPTIAQAIVAGTGSTDGVTLYLFLMVAASLTATLLLRDRRGLPLGPEHEDEQAHGMYVWHKR
ncbi:MFS transporter [Microbacterium sp. MEC084]|jgi:MFS family permease|uniref:MFS transporter n=1 Tax=unclassified Microbacterium TaxID=2609290 RepID=UPI0006F5C362|nr:MULTISPECIES: MFS transporter [unclassified Microbacterium]KQZ05200.1 MFS transporter [Microbacterium sp. Root53]MCD1268497.1 MFS transporter [Microbacterium sp. MEC084]